MATEDKDTFTKEDVEKLLADRETAIEAKFQDHIKKLNEENKTKRLSEKELKETLVKALGLNPDEKTDKDLLAEKIAEIAKINKELAEKFELSEKAKTKLEKEKEVSEALEKAGFQKKALKLIDLNGDVKAQIKLLETDYPELKGKKDVGTGSNPPSTTTVSFNPYKKDTFNITMQSKLERENAPLAAKLKAEAGVK